MKLFLAIFPILLFSCNHPEPTPPSVNEDADTSVIDEIKCNLDTTLASGARIVITYHYASDSFITSVTTPTWDTIFYLNDELAAQNSSINPMNEHVILWSSAQFAGIREGCGAPCDYEIVIPLIPGKKPQRYFFAYTNADAGIQLAENLIAFNGDHNTEDGYPMIKLENMLNGKRDSLAVDDTWADRVAMNEFVDTIFATMDYFFIGQLDQQGKLIAQKVKKVNLQ